MGRAWLRGEDCSFDLDTMDEKESILRVKRGARSKADLRGRGQVLKRSATIYRHIGCDQIPMQGLVDAGVQETD